MKKIIIVLSIVFAISFISVPQKAHASILWYLVGNSTGQSAGRSSQKIEDDSIILDLKSQISSLQSQLNICQIKTSKKIKK